MTEPMAPHRTTGTPPPPSAIGGAAALLVACHLISGRTGHSVAHR
jgi:hypothetical protein